MNNGFNLNDALTPGYSGRKWTKLTRVQKDNEIKRMSEALIEIVNQNPGDYEIFEHHLSSITDGYGRDAYEVMTGVATKIAETKLIIYKPVHSAEEEIDPKKLWRKIWEFINENSFQEGSKIAGIWRGSSEEDRDWLVENLARTMFETQMSNGGNNKTYEVFKDKIYSSFGDDGEEEGNSLWIRISNRFITYLITASTYNYPES